MRTHPVAGPLRHRPVSTLYIPAHRPAAARHAPPAHRAGETGRDDRHWAPAVAVCALAGVLAAALLGAAPEASTGEGPASVPWRAATPAGLLSTAGVQAHRSVLADGTGPLVQPLASTPLVLPVPHFIHLPYRQR
ncbi:hypothetical protein [Sinomonas terrae]|uniref:Uncharacterized protein n=1 Tax=Sinomonas terrae TaxID=2908838 RepID=A0ABS9TW32_9MICC|nr:hypothetical protein [Sinomonas terrae]MCH6468628.1 hypothetical protein [Sinomonas terrae]